MAYTVRSLVLNDFTVHLFVPRAVAESLSWKIGPTHHARYRPRPRSAPHKKRCKHG